MKDFNLYCVLPWPVSPPFHSRGRFRLSTLVKLPKRALLLQETKPMIHEAALLPLSGSE